jgi:hypothetical protein
VEGSRVVLIIGVSWILWVAIQPLDQLKTRGSLTEPRQQRIILRSQFFR